MVSIQKSKQSSFKLFRRKSKRGASMETLIFVGCAFFLGFFMITLFSVPVLDDNVESHTGRHLPETLRRTKKHPVLMETTEDGGDSENESFVNKDPRNPPRLVRPMDDGMNAIALEVHESLNCTELLKQAEEDLKQPAHYNEYYNRTDDFNNFNGNMTYGMMNDMPFVGYPDLSAQHLFCVAASESPPESIVKEFNCDASGKKRKTLLELWTDARTKMRLELLKKVLDLAKENDKSFSTILGEEYYIWAPVADNGLSYTINSLNNEADSEGGLNGLEEVLGNGKIFVDVGSSLGLTSLVINSKYPGTKIISIEPATPNWLLQGINLVCNMSRKKFKNINMILAGVGGNEGNNMAKFMWRPSSTASTRSWTPSSEYHEGEDIEIVVGLRKFKSILAEADVFPPTHVDVLNLDCQGCEYNMIPAMTKEELEEIPTVMARIHWGYMNVAKLPSSVRGKTTHERLCGHQSVAQHTKECCAFPDLPVKSRIPGEVLRKADSQGYPYRESKVSDVIDEHLCDDFSTWSEEHYLNAVQDDFNWLELSSQA